MRFASFLIDGRETWGMVEAEGVREVSTHPDLKSALGELSLLRNGAMGPLTPFSRITWQPVIPNPDKILGIGLNFDMHRQETGRAEMPYPTLFTRFANTQIGEGAALIKPIVSEQLDYEGELALVISKAGRHIVRENALSHVAGYACYNDASVRDFQRHTTQFTPGKNFPATGSFGPWLVTPDEVGPLADLQIRTLVNGVTVQDARLGEMIFDVPALVEYCSSFTRLEPGDVILTGTPAGIGSRRTPQLWLKAGDKVEVVIDRVGRLTNSVEAE